MKVNVQSWETRPTSIVQGDVHRLQTAGKIIGFVPMANTEASNYVH